MSKTMLTKSNLHALIRHNAQTLPAWATAIRYHTKLDERYDLTLVSRRVYGTPKEWPIIMAAAGLQSVDEALIEQLLILPTLSQLQTLKRFYKVI